jgi:hypothetical protein
MSATANGSETLTAGANREQSDSAPIRACQLICGASLMAIHHHKNRHHEPRDTNQASNTRAIACSDRHLKVIRASGDQPRAADTSDKRGGALPARSKGKVNDQGFHSGTRTSLRRLYVKPAFECQIVFSRVLMTRIPPEGAT